MVAFVCTFIIEWKECIESKMNEKRTVLDQCFERARGSSDIIGGGAGADARLARCANDLLDRGLLYARAFRHVVLNDAQARSSKNNQRLQHLNDEKAGCITSLAVSTIERSRPASVGCSSGSFP